MSLNHKTGEEGIPLWLNWRLTCLVVDAGMSALPPKADLLSVGIDVC